jgi:predicted ribosome quality control (RQC) complex YloA/Tae2 family protein
MACLADELRATILGGRVQQVLLPERLSVGLEVYAQRQRHYLLASAHTELGRLSLVSEKLRRGVDKETGLLLLLRKYARGARITAIEQPPFERVLHLRFDHPQLGSSDLVIEVMGRHSNLILVGPGQQVLDAVKRVGPHISPARPILPGQAYAPPPPQAKLPPSDLTEYRLRQILAAHEPDTQVWRALVRGLQGMSPLLAREISHRALGRPRAVIADVQRLTPLLEETRNLLLPFDQTCGRVEWQPTVVLEERRPVVYAPYPVTHRGEPQPMPSMSHAIESYVQAFASQDAYAAARRHVQEAIVGARKRLERRRESLQRSLAQGHQAGRWRQWGEWILAYAHAIGPGQTELVADTGTGEVLCIPLDPGRSPAENAQAYFARSRKAQKAVEGVPARIEEADMGKRDLEQLDTDLALASSRPEIDEVRAALVQAGYLPGRKPRSPRGVPSTPLSLTSPDGLPIWVGRNSRQNDEVTFRRAMSDDWWFHTRGVPGAHVIVRSIGQPLPEATIRRAAELAAFYSQLRDELDVAVDYTRRRYVRRIPGAAPGLVTYSQERTLRVKPVGPDTAPPLGDLGPDESVLQRSAGL